MKKRIISLIMVLAILAISSISAFAFESEAELNADGSQNQIITSYSEFEKYLQLRECSDNELIGMGYTDDEIKEIRSNCIEDELLRRSKLSYDELIAYGYNDDQIAILKKYDGRRITYDSEIMALSSNCHAYFYSSTCSSTSMAVRYTWEWTIQPLLLLQDKVVVCWQGINDSGITVDAVAAGYSCVVKYYNITTGAYVSGSDAYPSCSYSTITKSISADINMKSGDYYWAKKGTMYYTLCTNGNYTFNYINLGASYAHKTAACTISFTITSGLSISFSPSTKLTVVANNSAIIYPNGTFNPPQY